MNNNSIVKNDYKSINVLISCMHQDDCSIIERSNIQTDVVVVNQCNKDEIIDFDFKNKKGEECHARFINTKERGLSRSRNMAIKNAWGDICLLCDDDEILDDNYAESILDSYKRHPDKDAILFVVDRDDLPNGKNYSNKECPVGIRQILKSSSVQITFIRKKVLSSSIKFDIYLGSGSGNGGGEENKFLLDMKRNKFRIYYVPVRIGRVLTGYSLWFNGFTKQYMIDKGWTSRRVLGIPLGLLFIISFAIRHKSLYKSQMSFWGACTYLIKGFWEMRETASFDNN